MRRLIGALLAAAGAAGVTACLMSASAGGQFGVSGPFGQAHSPAQGRLSGRVAPVPAQRAGRRLRPMRAPA